MDKNVTTKVLQELGDLVEVILLCLLADEHCIIRVAHDSIGDTGDELKAITSERFGLSTTLIKCSADTSAENFRAIVHAEFDNDTSNAIIAMDLDLASKDVQIQALELMRSRQVHTSAGTYLIPMPFIFIALISASRAGPPYLTPHLNDHFFMSYIYNSASHAQNTFSDVASTSSQSSTIHHKTGNGIPYSNNSNIVPITKETLTHLKSSSSSVRMSAEVLRYTHNITSFLRLHRAVAGGVSALGSRHFMKLTRILPALSSLNYVTPSMVQKAAMAVYPHRIQLATPSNERSLQWGSTPEAVAEALEGVTAEAVVQDILDTVECPL